jgi:hypothetical protein
VVIGSLGGAYLGQLEGVAWGILLALLLNYIIAVSMSLRLLNSSWPEFLKTQVPGIRVGFLVASIALITKRYLFVDSSIASLLILLVTAALSALLIVSFVVVWPHFLGLYGLIALNRVLGSVPRRLSSNTLVRLMTNRISGAEERALARIA